jgi:hypothetical protein
MRQAPVLVPVKSILDEWIKEDLRKKKKFRRTAKRMWELLKGLHESKGSDRTVRDYVSPKKKELLQEADQVALPLGPIPYFTIMSTHFQRNRSQVYIHYSTLSKIEYREVFSSWENLDVLTEIQLTNRKKIDGDIFYAWASWIRQVDIMWPH